jgi:putative NADH-flavin reductase
MKLLLLGSTGKVGRLLLAQALSQGHEVTALVRDPAKITLSNDRLKVVAGNLKDPAALAPLMAGVDAVISTLGHNSTKKSDIQTAATRAVLANIKPGQRYISLTGQGVTDPKDSPVTLAGRITTALIKSVPGGMYEDGAENAQLMRESGADWVLVRAPVMTGGSPTRKYRTGYLRIGALTTARRADVADFMLANIGDNTWLRQAPIIAST